MCNVRFLMSVLVMAAYEALGFSSTCEHCSRAMIQTLYSSLVLLLTSSDIHYVTNVLDSDQAHHYQHSLQPSQFQILPLILLFSNDYWQ
jgi:hypothetical protein